jgi:hypothetical protein
MRGVCGGGRTRENSEARDVSGVCVEERVTRMLTFSFRRDTMD